MKTRAFHTSICLLAVLALFLMTAACATNTSPAASSTAASSTTAALSTTSPGTTASTTAQKLPPLELTMIASLYDAPPPKDDPYWKLIEDTFNVKLTVDWVPDSEYTAKIDLVLASGSIPDFIRIKTITAPSVIKAVSAGAFWEIGPTLGDFSKYPNLKNLNPNGWKLTTFDGKTYMLPRTRGIYGAATFVRGDWLDNLGLKVPTTLDEFKTMVIEFATKDPDKNGKKDTFGFGSDTAGWFEAGFGVKTPTYDANGGLIYSYFTEAYAKYVQYLKDLYTAGTMPSEFALLKDSQLDEMFLSGVLGAYRPLSVWHRFRVEQSLQAKDPKAYVAVIPFLKGADGNSAYNIEKGHDGGNFIASSVSKEKMLRILDFCEATAAPDKLNLIRFGVEGLHWSMKDGAPVLTDAGKKVISATNPQPFIYATEEYAKVDSPLAPVAYNLKTREMMQALNAIKPEPDIFAIIQSATFAKVWPNDRDTFTSNRTKAISGVISMDEFRKYQATFLVKKDYQIAFQEFTASYKGFFD